MVVDEVNQADVDRVFHAMADATRRNIMTRVLRQEQSVSTLAAGYAMSFAAIQKHVAVLERARLVRKEKRGREQIVHAVPGALHRAARLLDHYEEIWFDRVHRIEDILSDLKPPSHSQE